MPGRTDSRLRMVVVMLAFAIVATAATVRLGQWQLVDGPELAAQYDAVASSLAAAQPIRADIVDRDGVVLAKTSTFDQVVAYPDIIAPEDDEVLVETLAVLLDLDKRQRDDYLRAIAEGRDRGRQYVSLEPRISLEQSQQVFEAMEAKLLPGIDLEPRPVRHYPRRGGDPDTSLASHVIGFVRADGVGGEGIERYYDDVLTTVDPSTVDIASSDAGSLSLVGLEPEPLELTIDAKLQKQVERELKLALDANRAKSVSAIVMDPETGAILAAASVPSYDAEDFAAVANDDPSKLRNRVFQDLYEPGSVMKIFTAAAALELGAVKPSTPIRDQRKLEFYKATVRNADHGVRQNLTVKTAIAYSRNVATAKIARQLAPNSVQKAAERLHAFWDQVGLVGRTGVDVSAEAQSNSHPPDQEPWTPVDLANRAFGQGSSFTLVQLARGVSTLVNGGLLIQPHLAVGGEAADVKPERVIKARTARQAKDILRYVTGGVPWYAEGSLIPGFDIGGKTGTAQIWDVRKRDWKARRWNHSFVGFIGGRKQEYVIAVRIEEPVPKEIKQGRIPLGIESYGLYQMVARATIDQLGMQKLKDPNAGRPILGSEAARNLTPERNREALRTKRQTQQRAEPGKAKAKSADKDKATRGGTAAVTDSEGRSSTSAGDG